MNNDNNKKIILKRKFSFRRTLNAGPLNESTLPEIAKPEIEIVELSDREANDASRDPEVLAIADPMPLKLIEPAGEEPTPSSTGNTWGVEAIGADSSPFDGNGITVAVLDTGINPDHVAFSGVHLERRNFTTGSDDDENGHGTHCAGTIFGRDVDGLRIGVARGVSRALIGKVLGPGGGGSDTLAEAINWSYENGANVISMSLGIDFPGFVAHLINNVGLQPEPATSIALFQYRANIDLFGRLTALLAASDDFAQATIIVAASGNESNRPSFDIAVAPPAAGDGIISVGALQKSASGNLSVARFSNTQCNLSGPGVSVTSAWTGSANALRTISGTSMATPHVAGCAALWAQRQLSITGNLTNEILAAKVLASAKFIPGASFMDIGNGLVKAPQS